MTKAPKRAARSGRPDSTRTFEAATRRAARQPYDLCLYIAGTTPHSSAAVATITALCEERLKGHYTLVVVDIYQEPARARADQIIAVPTLLKRGPLPRVRLIGDLSDRAKVLAGLNLVPDTAGGA